MALGEQNSADQTLDGSTLPAVPQPAISTDANLQETLAGTPTTIRRPAMIAPEIDGYEITGRLGEGGMGVVWKATQHGTHRPVALKLMSAASFGSERARLRFQREVDLTARLEHPHIARVYDGGENRGICYYAMEFIDGLPLDQHVRGQKLTRTQILELMKTICEAVQYAHQKGVIHRDLKPANIMVDKEGKPRVLDFGLAKALSDDDGQMLSMDMSAAGTPAYMSPEQAAGHLDQVDTRSDVYTLGVILFYLLSGKYPHDIHGSALEVMKRISELEPCRLKDIEPKADRDLEALLSKTLAKEPERRYGTAGDLAADVGRYLNGEPLVAQLPTMNYLIGKRLRKHRVPLAVAAGVVVLLLGMAVWAYVKVAKERNEAQTAKDVALAANVEKERQRQEAETQRNDAIRQRTVAQLQKAEADRQRNAAIEQKHQAELRTAESLLAQGNAFGFAGRWNEARSLYDEARQDFQKLDVPVLAVDAGLAKAYARSPVPLLTLSGHESAVEAVVVCPDGATAISGCWDKTIRIWDLKTGRAFRTLRGHDGGVNALEVSRDGKRLLSASRDKTLKVWDLQTGNVLQTLRGHTDDVKCIAMSPDGKSAVSGGMDQIVRFWDLETGSQIWATADQGKKIRCVALMPDGKTALSVVERFITQWDLADRKLIRTFNRLSGHTIDRLRISSGGQQLLLAEGREIHLIDFDGNEIKYLAGHTGVIWTLSQPGPTTIISGSQDGTLKVWDLARAREKYTLSGHGRDVRSIDIADGGRMIVSASSDKTLKLWDLTGAQDVRAIQRGLRGIAVSPDGRVGLSGNTDGSLTLFDLATAREIRRFAVSKFSLGDVAILPNGEFALSANGDAKTMSLWDLGSGIEVHVMRGHDGPVNHLAVSPDGTTAISCSDDKTVRWWDLATGKLIRLLGKHPFVVSGAAFSNDGKTAASVGGKVLKVWNLEKGSDRTVPLPDFFTGAVLFCPDGRHVITSMTNDFGIVDLQTAEVVRTFRGHTNRVDLIHLSRDGRFIVSGAKDQTVRIWDVQSGKELQSIEASGVLECLTISSDCQTVVLGTSSSDGIETWDWTRPAMYREMDKPVGDAQTALQANPDDPGALAVLGRWWAFRGINDWAAELLEKARAGGAEVSPLTLGRCYWQLDRFAEARQEFATAIAQSKDEPERYYLQLCIGALDRSQAAGHPASTK